MTGCGNATKNYSLAGVKEGVCAMTETNPTYNYVDRLCAYAYFRGQIEGIAKSIDWIKLDKEKIKYYLEESIRSLDNELKRYPR